MENQILKEGLKIGKDIERKERLNITLFLSGKIVSLLGSFSYSLAISWYILSVTGSATTFAISVLLGMLPRVLFGPFAGALADRFDRKKLTVGLDALSGLIVLTLLGVSTIYGLRISFIYITSFCLAVTNTLFDVSISASLPNLVTDKKLLKINSYSQAVTSLAGILGPVLGGVIYGLVPIKLFLLINGLSFIVSSISEMFINFKLNKQEEDNEQITNSKINLKSISEDIKEVLGFIKEKKALFTILKFAIVFNLLLTATVSVVLPFIINNVLKMNATQLGIIQGSFGVGVLITSIIIGNTKEKKRYLKSFVLGTAIIGLMTMAIGLSALGGLMLINTNILFIYLMVVLFVFAVSMVIVNTPLNLSIQRLTPDKIRGRVWGVLGAISGGIAPLGIVIVGIIIDMTPPYIIPIVSGLLIILLAVVMKRSKSMKSY